MESLKNPATFSVSENQKTSPSTQVLQTRKAPLIAAQEDDARTEGTSVNTLHEVIPENGVRKAGSLFAGSSNPSSSCEPYNEIAFCYSTIKEALNRNRQKRLFRQ